MAARPWAVKISARRSDKFASILTTCSIGHCSLYVNESIVRYQVEFMYRHRLSNEMLTGRCRFVMTVVDGLIVRADEYHDRAKVEAFMRLFGNIPPR
jgi:hypothetical protein